MEYVVPLILIGAISYWVFFRKGVGGGCCGGAHGESCEKGSGNASEAGSSNAKRAGKDAQKTCC